MVRVEVVRDIGVDTRPRLERFELELRLRHVRVVEVEVTELLGSGAGIVVRRVESLVVLHEADESLLLGKVNELLVVLQLLRSGLGDENVVAQVECLGSDGEVRGVGREDDDGGPLGQGLESGLVYESAVRWIFEQGDHLQASGSRVLPSGNPRKDRSSPLYTSPMFFWKCVWISGNWM